MQQWSVHGNGKRGSKEARMRMKRQGTAASLRAGSRATHRRGESEARHFLATPQQPRERGQASPKGARLRGLGRSATLARSRSLPYPHQTWKETAPRRPVGAVHALAAAAAADSSAVPLNEQCTNGSQGTACCPLSTREARSSPMVMLIIERLCCCRQHVSQPAPCRRLVRTASRR